MRDLGGIKTRNGLTLRHGCLIRSGNLHNATPEELNGVSEIIDFRTSLEEEKKPDIIPNGKAYRRIILLLLLTHKYLRDASLSDASLSVDKYMP